MNVAAVEVFTSILAVAALCLAVLVTVGRLLRSRVPMIDEAMVAVDDAALWLGFLIAASATAGSLYFSEVADYLPCKMCWFQRIAMYPLAAILLIAAIRRDRDVRWYVIPIAAVGSVISIYHYVIEWRPSLEVGDACGLGPSSCTTVWFREFGFVTLPFMALCGFLAVIALVAGGPGRTGNDDLSSTTTDPEQV